ncbi:MAG: putative N-acetylmannosamine-6-phosphate 2-epimerase [Rhizobiales bacterium]|nr:putative N-acetylmannosamine-6-phosphate 2-epimerase [Hyphomicrobiales bacterium]NRB14327.1 putative N-acetylmannosamine-6-phosphate 2-epimerase [Hyphomicrobiales bacterium]
MLDILTKINRRLIASCQPVDNGPMDRPDIVLSMAQAAQIGGAGALRIEGIKNLEAVSRAIDLPIIGLLKRDLLDSSVRITPFIEDVTKLAKNGADIIAYDATNRPRPVSTTDLVAEIKLNNCIAMADCASMADAIQAIKDGADIIGTTLSGYAYDEVSSDALPDFELIKQFTTLNCFVMAEGRFNSPHLAKKAMQCGANAVTVGSAITRVENITSWFVDQIENENNAEN